MADLKEKVVLVTDAGRSLGRGIAEGLAEAGATLYLAVGSTAAGDGSAACSPAATAAAIEQLGGRVVAVELDQSEDEALLELFRRVESEAGRLDVLVSNVPDDPAGADPFWQTPFGGWDDHSGSRLRACYAAAALAARLMVEQGSGLIISLSMPAGSEQRSVAGDVSQAGVETMTESMARELAAHQVTALTLTIADRQAFASPRYVGRAVAALAMDPDVHEKTAGNFDIDVLRSEYRFSDLPSDEPEALATGPTEES